MKSTILISTLSVMAFGSAVSAQASLNVNVNVATPQVAVPTVAVPTVAVPTVVVAQPVATGVVVVPTVAQLAAADDDPSEEPVLQATMAPPAMQVEVQGTAPGAGHVWVPGYWRWRGNRYVWRAGSWKRPRMQGVGWIPGGWQPAGGGRFVWSRGRWGGVAVNAGPGPTVVTTRPNGAVVVNQPGPGSVVVRPNGAVVVNQPGPGSVVVRPNGGVVIRRPGPDIRVGPNGGVHIQGGGHGGGHGHGH